jgi:3-oxoacyl-[acyl-carrier protein] reductase
MTTPAISLENHVCFVTGSSRGIGLATARALIAAGAHVIVSSATDGPHLSKVVDELGESGGSVEGIGCDAADPAQVRAAYQHIFKDHKRLDLLVNNAGVLDDALIGMVSDEALSRTFDVNALGAIHHLQAASRLMMRSRSGSIVNITSIVGVNGNKGQIAYASSKAALVGLTKAAAKELAPNNIRVNAVAPGFIDTDMARQLSSEVFAERVSSIGMGRIGSPSDVANAVLFFASDLSAYVTGQVLGVDGSMLI